MNPPRIPSERLSWGAGAAPRLATDEQVEMELHAVALAYEAAVKILRGAGLHPWAMWWLASVIIDIESHATGMDLDYAVRTVADGAQISRDMRVEDANVVKK